MGERQRCQAAIYKRDTWRVSRRGDGRHFRMHYEKHQCSRAAVEDGLCRQHIVKGGFIERLDWHAIVEKPIRTRGFARRGTGE